MKISFPAPILFDALRKKGQSAIRGNRASTLPQDRPGATGSIYSSGGVAAKGSVTTGSHIIGPNGFQVHFAHTTPLGTAYGIGTLWINQNGGSGFTAWIYIGGGVWTNIA